MTPMINGWWPYISTYIFRWYSQYYYIDIFHPPVTIFIDGMVPIRNGVVYGMVFPSFLLASARFPCSSAAPRHGRRLWLCALPFFGNVGNGEVVLPRKWPRNIVENLRRPRKSWFLGSEVKWLVFSRIFKDYTRESAHSSFNPPFPELN